MYKLSWVLCQTKENQQDSCQGNIGAEIFGYKVIEDFKRECLGRVADPYLQSFTLSHLCPKCSECPGPFLNVLGFLVIPSIPNFLNLSLNIIYIILF